MAAFAQLVTQYIVPHAERMKPVQEVIMRFKREHLALQSKLNLAYSQKEGASAWLGKKLF